MSDELAADLAARLRQAHLLTRTVDLSDDEKAKLARRLVAISDTAKRDLAGASGRLDRLMTELGIAP